MSTGTVDRFQRHVPKGWSALRHSCLLSETECVVPIFAVSPLKALRILGHMAWNPGSAPGIRQSCHSWGKSRAHQWRWLVARREQPKRKAVHPCFVLPEIKLKMQNVPCCKTCMGFLGCPSFSSCSHLAVFKTDLKTLLFRTFLTTGPRTWMRDFRSWSRHLVWHSVFCHPFRIGRRCPQVTHLGKTVYWF